MTLAQYEESSYESEPLEIYEFSRGSEFWRYTSTDRDVNVLGQDYIAYPIRRQNIESTQDIKRSNLKIETVRNLPIADQFIAAPPADEINLIIRRTQVADTVDGEVVVIFIGRLINVTFQGGDKVQLTCEPLQSSLKRPGLRRLYQTGCPHILYGGQCGVSRSSFSVAATLTNASGLVLSSAAFSLNGDGYYDGGFIEYQNPKNSVDKRLILTQVGADITIGSPIVGLPANANVTVFPGCDRTTDTCLNKFSNLDNYGGFPGIPRKNPFNSGSTIF